MNTKPSDPTDPAPMRQVFFATWQKHLKGEPLMPIEAMIVSLIEAHPEYEPLFRHVENFELYEQEKFALDHNPFFHLACHLVIKEQVMIDKPTGIRALYEQCLKKTQDPTAAEHRMMPALTKILMEQRDPCANEETMACYLEDLKKSIFA